MNACGAQAQHLLYVKPTPTHLSFGHTVSRDPCKTNDPHPLVNNASSEGTFAALLTQSSLFVAWIEICECQSALEPFSQTLIMNKSPAQADEKVTDFTYSFFSSQMITQHRMIQVLELNGLKNEHGTISTSFWIAISSITKHATRNLITGSSLYCVFFIWIDEKMRTIMFTPKVMCIYIFGMSSCTILDCVFARLDIWLHAPKHFQKRNNMKIAFIDIEMIQS